MFVLAACSPGELQIREIVKEEMRAASVRQPILDANTIGPYSPAQRAGNFLFVSGQIALNPATGSMENATIETETAQVLRNVLSVLKSAGFDSSDVVSTTVYLTDMGNFAKMNGVYASFFPKGNYPTRATVQVAALPRNANVEITAIAYKAK